MLVRLLLLLLLLLVGKDSLVAAKHFLLGRLRFGSLRDLTFKEHPFDLLCVGEFFMFLSRERFSSTALRSNLIELLSHLASKLTLGLLLTSATSSTTTLRGELRFVICRSDG